MTKKGSTIIIVIIIVFDPLAILLLIASQQTLKTLRNNSIKSFIKDEEVVDKSSENDVQYQYNPDEIYEIIPKERVAKFKKDGDII